MPRRAHALLAVRDLRDLPRLILRHQQLGGLQPLELGFERGPALGLQHREPAGREVEPGEAERGAFLRRPRHHRG